MTSTYTAGTGVWTASGAIADVNALLAGCDVYAGGELQWQLLDRHQRQRRGGAGHTGTKAFTGIAVNDAPTATNLSAAETYTEDTPLNLTDIVVSDVDSAT